MAEQLNREGKEVANYVASFIARRFPDGLPDTLEEVIKHIVFDAFVDGLYWGEASGDRRSKIIIDPYGRH